MGNHRGRFEREKHSDTANWVRTIDWRPVAAAVADKAYGPVADTAARVVVDIAQAADMAGKVAGRVAVADNARLVGSPCLVALAGQGIVAVPVGTGLMLPVEPACVLLRRWRFSSARCAQPAILVGRSRILDFQHRQACRTATRPGWIECLSSLPAETVRQPSFLPPAGQRHGASPPEEEIPASVPRTSVKKACDQASFGASFSSSIATRINSHNFLRTDSYTRSNSSDQQ